jgi:hypothetical protein
MNESIMIGIAFIVGAIIGLVFGAMLGVQFKEWYLERKKKKENLKILWETYAVNFERFKLWRARYPAEGDMSPDAQSLLLQALGPLTHYVDLTADPKAIKLRNEHMKLLQNGQMVPSRNDPPQDRLQ